MTFNSGDKVKVRRGHIQHDLEKTVAGTVISSTTYDCLVQFRVTRQQLNACGWSYDHRDGSYYMVHRNYNAESLLKIVELTVAETAELKVLKAKTDRSPVEDYILFGLESEDEFA
jgi:hypothetical protein